MAAPSSAQPSGSVSPRSGSLVSGQHRGRVRDDSNPLPPPQPSNPPSPRPSIPPRAETPPPSEVPAEELPGIVRRLFAELEDDFEVAFRTQQQVGSGKPQLLRLSLEEQIENQLVQVSEQTRLSDSQADLIRRAQKLHLEKMWAVFRATHQTRPDRVLADDADLAALLNELAHPGSMPASAPGEASSDPPRSVSPQVLRVPNNTESEGSLISGAGMARPARTNSGAIRPNAALRMSGTFSPVNGNTVSEAPRPVSPMAQRANTGTVIAQRRNSSVPEPAMPPSPRRQSNVADPPTPSQTRTQASPPQPASVLAMPPPPSAAPPPIPHPVIPKAEASPYMPALPIGLRRTAVSFSTPPSVPEVARSRTDQSEGVNISAHPSIPHALPTLQETILRQIQEIRSDPNPLRAASNNAFVQIALGVLLLLAVMPFFIGGSSPASAQRIPPLDPAVAALLDRLDLAAYKPVLATHRLDWTCMNQLRPELLVTIGVPLGHALRIVDAVNQPLPAAERNNAESLVDGASADARLMQTAAVSLITSDAYATVQRIKTLLKDTGAEVKETTRDAGALVSVSIAPAQWRKALDATLALSSYNHFRTSVQDVAAELREKSTLLQQVEADIDATKALLDKATAVSDQLAARTQLRSLSSERASLKARLQVLEAGTARSSLVITVRPQDFDASGAPRSGFLLSLLHLVFNTPLFFVLAGVGYVLYRRFAPAQRQ